jgi:hypothetical protein
MVRDNGPLYRGKRLSTYVRSANPAILWVCWDSGTFTLDPPSVRPKFSDLNAYDAIQTTGTNALPLLIHMLRSKDSWVITRLRELGEKYPLVQ